MSRSYRTRKKENEYTETESGVDPDTFNLQSAYTSSGPLCFNPTATDSQAWARYYKQGDPGTSNTEIFDTDEAKHTMSLILQEESEMAA